MSCIPELQMKRSLIGICLAGCLLLLVACSKSKKDENLPITNFIEPVITLKSPTYPKETWETASPEEVGLQDNLVESLFKELKLDENLGSAILVKDGFIIEEYYANSQFELAMSNSVAKSMYATSFLKFMNAENISLQDKIRDFLPEFIEIEGQDNPEVNSSLHRRTFGDLMSMQSGMVNLKNLDEKWYQKDVYKLVFSLTTIDDFYGYWDYNNANIIFQTIAIQRRCNCSVKDLLGDINALLQIRSADLLSNSFGDPVTYGGILMNPRDFTRWGYLWAKECNWDGTEVLDSETCNKMLEITHTPEKCFVPNYNYPDYTLCEGMQFSYAYNFYYYNGWYLAIGAGGQYIIFNKDYDIVLATFTIQDNNVTRATQINILNWFDYLKDLIQ